MKRYDIPCWVRWVAQLSQSFTLGQILQPFCLLPLNSQYYRISDVHGPSLPLAFGTPLLAFVHEIISSCLGQCCVLVESWNILSWEGAIRIIVSHSLLLCLRDYLKLNHVTLSASSRHSLNAGSFCNVRETNTYKECNNSFGPFPSHVWHWSQSYLDSACSIDPAATGGDNPSERTLCIPAFGFILRNSC